MSETLDFFATPTFFAEAAETLCEGGTLHLASNVEDVALRLYDSAMFVNIAVTACQTRFGCGWDLAADHQPLIRCQPATNRRRGRA